MLIFPHSDFQQYSQIQIYARYNQYFKYSKKLHINQQKRIAEDTLYENY